MTDADFDLLCHQLKCKRLAFYDGISDDDFRTPKITFWKGSPDDPFVIHTENGIKYRFNIMKNMFSIGNISEKIRVSKFNCDNQIVIDLFAGIGYFTLQFLKHTNVTTVHAVDWNPDAISSLKANLILNKIPEDKCIIHFGDNRHVTPVNIADRIYLGLIPSSRDSWETAVRGLKSATGGYLHIHENVSFFNMKRDKLSKQQIIHEWESSVVSDIQRLLQKVHPEAIWSIISRGSFRVKSYAPHINHMVVDIDCRPTVT